MSDFMLLSTDASLWELAMKVRWGSHDFCLVVKNFQVQVITQAQLNTLSQTGAWGDAEKPWWDMAFLLIVPTIAMGYKRVFGLVAVWMHPNQSLLLLSRGGSLQTCTAGIHLCLAKQGPISCAPIKWGTCQHHDRWHALCECLWLAPPVADMQTIAATTTWWYAQKA